VSFSISCNHIDNCPFHLLYESDALEFRDQPGAKPLIQTNSHILFLLERDVHLLTHAILAMIMDHSRRERRIAYLRLCKDEVDFFECFPCSLSSGPSQHPLSTETTSQGLRRAYLRTHVIYERHGDRTRQKHPYPNLPANVLQCNTTRKDRDEAE